MGSILGYPSLGKLPLTSSFVLGLEIEGFRGFRVFGFRDLMEEKHIGTRMVIGIPLSGAVLS